MYAGNVRSMLSDGNLILYVLLSTTFQFLCTLQFTIHFLEMDLISCARMHYAQQGYASVCVCNSAGILCVVGMGNTRGNGPHISTTHNMTFYLKLLVYMVGNVQLLVYMVGNVQKLVGLFIGLFVLTLTVLHVVFIRGSW